MLGNRPLVDTKPEQRALKTRLTSLHVQATDLEIGAKMRAIALDERSPYHEALSKDERLNVADYIISESRRLNRPLNLRHLQNGLADYLQWSDLDAGCDWRDLISSRLRERPAITTETVSVGIRAQKKQEELDLVRAILCLPPEQRLEQWRQQTGKSKSAMYRRLAELGEVDDSHFRDT